MFVGFRKIHLDTKHHLTSIFEKTRCTKALPLIWPPLIYRIKELNGFYMNMTNVRIIL